MRLTKRQREVMEALARGADTRSEVWTHWRGRSDGIGVVDCDRVVRALARLGLVTDTDNLALTDAGRALLNHTPETKRLDDSKKEAGR